MWPQMTSRGHRLPRGRMWPHGVPCGLGGSGIALRITDGLVGFQMALGAVGGHGGSLVASGVAIDLRGCR
jgi:hypothetical protein